MVSPNILLAPRWKHSGSSETPQTGFLASMAIQAYARINVNCCAFHQLSSTDQICSTVVFFGCCCCFVVCLFFCSSCFIRRFRPYIAMRKLFLKNSFYSESFVAVRASSEVLISWESQKIQKYVHKVQLTMIAP